MNFLIVEDDENFSAFLSKNLAKHGKTFVASNFQNAKNLLESFSFDCAILDLKLGHEIVGPKIAHLAKQKGVAHVIAVTHFENDDELIKEAYESGVDDFVKKSNLRTHIEFFIQKFVNSRNLQKNLLRLTKTTYLTKDKRLIDSLGSICDTYSLLEPIFIRGESGVGKTQLGKCLKELMGLTGELVELNCAGLNDEILKSELFGHEKGAFTGADKLKIGKMEKAHKGILFCDEVGDMPLPTQEKLLKALDERKFTRVGGLDVIQSDFLLVAATLKNPEELVATGKLRVDFYNRIMGKSIYLSPLRERKADIKFLIEHFLNLAPRSVYLEPQAKKALLDYSWPGNIRELRKVINALSDTKNGIVRKENLPLHIIENKNPLFAKESRFITEEQIAYAKERKSLPALIDKITKDFYAFALEESCGNKSSVINDYNLAKSTFYRKKKVLGNEVSL
jgi:DNA-binding NtrC family response regulator